MNFEWTEQQQAFRARVRDFIARELPPDFERRSKGGPASREVTEFSMRFCAKLADEGLLVPHWPKEWGGNGATAYEHFILGEEMWMAGEPRGGQYMNVNWIGTTLLRFGSEARHLSRVAVAGLVAPFGERVGEIAFVDQQVDAANELRVGAVHHRVGDIGH